MKRVEVGKITLKEAREKIGIVRREERESNLKPVPNRDLSQSVVRRNSLIQSISPTAQKIRSQLPYPNRPTRKRKLSESDGSANFHQGNGQITLWWHNHT